MRTVSKHLLISACKVRYQPEAAIADYSFAVDVSSLKFALGLDDVRRFLQASTKRAKPTETRNLLGFNPCSMNKRNTTCIS